MVEYEAPFRVCDDQDEFDCVGQLPCKVSGLGIHVILTQGMYFVPIAKLGGAIHAKQKVESSKNRPGAHSAIISKRRLQLTGGTPDTGIRKRMDRRQSSRFFA